MAEFFKGTLTSSPLVRGSSGDTYGTHHSVLGIGGYMEFKTLLERNSLPVDSVNGIYFDDISSGQRRLGMLAHVLETNEIYHLHPKIGSDYMTLVQWNALTNNDKLARLSDNNNWYSLLSTVDSNANGERIEKDYYQIIPNFGIGDPIGWYENEFVKVNSFNAKTIEPLGIVTNKWLVSGTTYGFTLTYAGHISTSTFTTYTGGTLNNNTVYYLAPSGVTYLGNLLTKYNPTSISEISKPMLVTTSGATGIVLQYRGINKLEQGVSISSFNTYTANTNTFLNTTVTGATNIGFFSGKTGIQKINILSSNSAYNGVYDSLYNYYYRDMNGIIRIGSPTYHGTLRRGYVSEFTPKKSWLYNTYTGSSNQTGWILVDGDISSNVGNFLSANNTGANAGLPVFTQSEWSYTGGTGFNGYYTNTGLSLDVNGNFYTGSTYNIGGGVYYNKQSKELRFRTIVSSDESRIKVTYDDNYIYLSGASAISGGTSSGTTIAANIGTGIGLYETKTGNTLQFRSVIGSGDTTISNVNNTLIVYTCNNNGTYDLSSPAVCTVGGINSGTTLTGFTAFELFEKLLSPELYPTLTAPSISLSVSPSTALYEIGCTISSFNVIGTFDRGCISPQYCSTSNKRSGNPIQYTYTGAQVAGTYACTANTISRTVTAYSVCSGLHTWGISGCYDSGIQPIGNCGTSYCSPLPSGSISGTTSISGVYPLFATTSTISILDKQALLCMSTANNVEMCLVAETGGNKQRFEIPCAWIGAPTNRPLTGVLTYNSVANAWCYEGGTAGCSLTAWTPSSVVETIQGNSINYERYTFNGIFRGAVCVRLQF
jgi:hypothetical protein